jgi:tetratricopeptide (TPR) repeat protein
VHSPSHEQAAVAAELGRIHALLGELEPAGERIDEALEIGEALDLADVLSDALSARYMLLQWSGRDEDARSSLERALAIARENDLHRPLLRALYNLSFEVGVWDRVVEAMRIDQEGLELARACGYQSFEYRFIWGLVEGDVWLGDWDAALRVAAECYSWHGRHVAVLSSLPWLFVQRGELGEARRALEKLAPLAARDGVQPRSLEAVARAVVRRAEGRAREALAAAEEVLARRASLGGRHGWVKLAFVEAVEAAFALDDLDRIAELLDEWELRSSEQRTPLVEAQEQRFAGRLAARRGEADAVEPSFVRATEIFREISFPFYVAVTLLERAEWLAGSGRSVDAGPLLDRAQEIFERLRAAPWLERVSQARPPSDERPMRRRRPAAATEPAL